MKSGILVFIAFLLAANVAFAFDMSIEKETLIAPLDSTSSVDVAFSGGDETISLSLVGEKPWMLITPTQFDLKPGQDINVSLYASPKTDTPIGLYRVRVAAEGRTTKETKSEDLYISVERASGVYVDRVVVSGDMEPTGTVSMEFRLKNFGTSTISDIAMSVEVKNGDGSVFKFTEMIGKVDPLKDKTLEKAFALPENSPAGTYEVKSKLSYQDVSRETGAKFTVAERPVMKKSVTDYVPSVAGFRKSIEIKNAGNVAGDYTLAENVSSFDSVFYSGTSPSYSTSSEYVWKIISLKPGESTIISYRVDYMPLILFLFAILVFSWYILVKLRTIRITKFIMQKRTIEEGAEFTIGLDVKNASGTNVEDILVHDFVPSVFEVKESDGPKPVKRKAAHGTELEWKLGELFNKEERILSYKITPVFGVSGQIALPTAKVRFKFGNKATENSSNMSSVGVTPKEKDKGLEDIFLKKKK